MALPLVWLGYVSAATRAATQAIQVSGGLSGQLATVVGRAIARVEYSGAVGRVGSFVIGQISGNWTAELTYRQNALTQNQIPDPTALLHAYWTGHLSLGQLAHNLHWNNVPFSGFEEVQDNYNRETWRNVLRSTKPQLDSGLVVSLYQQGKMGEDEATSRLRRNGVPWTDAVNYFLFSKGWYNLSVANTLWLQGAITDTDYRASMSREGIGELAAQDALISQRSVAPLAAFAQWWLSGWIDDETYRWRLSREGISSQTDQDRLLKMRTPVDLSQARSDYWTKQAGLGETARRLQLLGYGTEEERRVAVEVESPYAPSEALRLYYRGEISAEVMRGHVAAGGIVDQQRQDSWIRGSRPTPGPGDLVSFAVHEVWDPDVVARLQYDAEFPDQLAYWMQVQGWGWGAHGAALQPVPPGQVDWPIAYWRNHWRPITEQMAHECWQRLRPERIERFQQQVPGVMPFVRDDYDRALKVLDYSPTNRKWIEATSFQVLPIVSARILYRSGKRDRAWLVAQALDRGYVQEDAEALVDAEDARAALQLQRQQEAMVKKATQLAIAQVTRGYTLGTITLESAVGQLHDLGMEEDVGRSYLLAVAARENLDVVQTSIKTLRKAYLSGEFAPGELGTRLAGLGLFNDAIQRYVAQWSLQRTYSRRMLSTEKIQSYVANGKLPVAEARARLVNLGWSQPDMLLLLGEAQQKADALDARARKAEEAAKGKRQRELERVNKDAAALIRKNQNHLARLTPVSTLRRLVCEAIVSSKWAQERLLAMGYDEETVNLYVVDWEEQAKGNKKCKPPKVDDDPPAKAPSTTPDIPAPSSGKMTLGGQEIPAGGLPQKVTVQPVGKQ